LSVKDELAVAGGSKLSPVDLARDTLSLLGVTVKSPAGVRAMLVVRGLFREHPTGCDV
jgi:hypothetical protein